MRLAIVVVMMWRGFLSLLACQPVVLHGIGRRAACDSPAVLCPERPFRTFFFILRKCPSDEDTRPEPHELPLFLPVIKGSSCGVAPGTPLATS